jgi:large subunit ribosomal protein L22e/Meckel syndrome type 1 protein
MNRLILAAALAAGCTLASSSPVFAAARNYDCSKPGNGNKAACKSAAASAAKAAAKPAPVKAAAASKPKTTKVASTTTTKTVTQRNYDCSKAGNKNKAMCKSAAATLAKPMVKQTTVATRTRHYDCTKPGNANKEQCKVSTSSRQAASKPVAMPRAAPATMRPARMATNASAEDHNPAGAIATCKDGTYSHSKVRNGACSRHGGVAKWM